MEKSKKTYQQLISVFNIQIIKRVNIIEQENFSSISIIVLGVLYLFAKTYKCILHSLYYIETLDYDW